MKIMQLIQGLLLGPPWAYKTGFNLIIFHFSIRGKMSKVIHSRMYLQSNVPFLPTKNTVSTDRRGLQLKAAKTRMTTSIKAKL